MEIDFYGKDKEDTMGIRLTSIIIILCILCTGCAHGPKPAGRFEEIMASGETPRLFLHRSKITRSGSKMVPIGKPRQEVSNETKRLAP